MKNCSTIFDYSEVSMRNGSNDIEDGKLDHTVTASKVKEEKWPQVFRGKQVRKFAVSSKRAKTARLIGPKKLTRFERARVVGARALQISMGAPVLIDVSQSSKSPIDIALMELEHGVLPISIRRTLPDGESQNIPLKVLLEGGSRK